MKDKISVAKLGRFVRIYMWKRELPTRVVALAMQKAYGDVDWERLWKRLHGYAAFLAGGAYAAFDCGMSAEDLVNETLGVFFEDPNALGWKPKKGKLETFLCKVLKNKFIDHVRRDQHVAGSFDDEQFSESYQQPSVEPQGDPASESSTFVDLLRQKTKGDQDLEDLIEAAELIEDGHNVNRQMAELLKTTVAEVVNRKKRLLRVEGVRELYERRG